MYLKQIIKKSLSPPINISIKMNRSLLFMVSVFSLVSIQLAVASKVIHLDEDNWRSILDKEWMIKL